MNSWTWVKWIFPSPSRPSIPSPFPPPPSYACWPCSLVSSPTSSVYRVCIIHRVFIIMKKSCYKTIIKESNKQVSKASKSSNKKHIRVNSCDIMAAGSFLTYNDDRLWDFWIVATINHNLLFGKILRRLSNDVLAYMYYSFDCLQHTLAFLLFTGLLEMLRIRGRSHPDFWVYRRPEGQVCQRFGQRRD